MEVHTSLPAPDAIGRAHLCPRGGHQWLGTVTQPASTPGPGPLGLPLQMEGRPLCLSPRPLPPCVWQGRAHRWEPLTWTLHTRRQRLSAEASVSLEVRLLETGSLRASGPLGPPPLRRQPRGIGPETRGRGGRAAARRAWGLTHRGRRSLTVSRPSRRCPRQSPALPEIDADSAPARPAPPPPRKTRGRRPRQEWRGGPCPCARGRAPPAGGAGPAWQGSGGKGEVAGLGERRPPAPGCV